MAKKKVKKSEKAAPKLEVQGRQDVAPPVDQAAYQMDVPQPPKQSMADVAKAWFKAAKDVARPDGEFMGVKEELFDIKDFAFDHQSKKEPK